MRENDKRVLKSYNSIRGKNNGKFMISNHGERILKYSWVEFLKTPFSLLFFTICICLGYTVYSDKRQAIKDKEKYEVQLYQCNESRLKDREVYMELINNIKLNKQLIKDSVK